jgi:hypothetical protein
MREHNSRSRFPSYCSDSQFRPCLKIERSSSLPSFFIVHYGPQRISAYAEQGDRRSATSSFLLPPSCLKCSALSVRLRFIRVYCIQIIPPAKCGKTLAMRLSIRFTCRMIRADNTDSKLCAEVPRHATENFHSEISAAQLGKGQGFAPPRCIPSHVPQAAAETVPVSAPSARRAVVAFAVWAVCP